VAPDAGGGADAVHVRCHPRPSPRPRDSRPPAPETAAPAGEIVGYASYGPERGLNGTPRTRRDSPHSRDHRRAELYALYVTPGWWSTGTGRALMHRVLEETRREDYPRIVLWVLAQNVRARRFYERAGFRPQGRSHVLHELGGVTEICYERDMTPP
jgi:GNAT superfamily N-acetyltransferase